MKKRPLKRMTTAVKIIIMTIIITIITTIIKTTIIISNKNKNQPKFTAAFKCTYNRLTKFFFVFFRRLSSFTRQRLSGVNISIISSSTPSFLFQFLLLLPFPFLLFHRVTFQITFSSRHSVSVSQPPLFDWRTRKKKKAQVIIIAFKI